ncbi:MAG: hypothetical protein ACI8PB_002617 [Desulforhopalus sp.]|jgi:hypothetical protein
MSALIANLNVSSPEKGYTLDPGMHFMKYKFCNSYFTLHYLRTVGNKPQSRADTPFTPEGLSVTIGRVARAKCLRSPDPEIAHPVFFRQ